MTDQVSPDWISMVSAAQATTVPAVITTTQTWTGEELLARAAGAARWLADVRTARRDSRTCPAAGEPRSARPSHLRRRRQASDRAARPPADRARAGPGCVERLAAPSLLTQAAFADTATAVALGLERDVLTLGDWRGAAGAAADPSPDDPAIVLHTSGTTRRTPRRCLTGTTGSPAAPG